MTRQETLTDGYQFSLSEEASVPSVPNESIKRRQAEIKALRASGVKNSRIAQQLEISAPTPYRDIAELVSTGEITSRVKSSIGEKKPPPQKTPPIRELDEQVLELRNDPRNLSNQQIARELSRPLYTIARSIHRLIEAGKLKKRERIAGNIAVSEKVRMREEKIVRLRSQKPMLTNEQIAEKLDISLTPLGRSIKRLVKAGKVERRSSRPKTEQEIEFGIETTEDRDNYVERMRKQGATNSEIAAKLGRTMGTIHRSVRRLIEAGRITRRTRGKFGVVNYLTHHL